MICEIDLGVQRTRTLGLVPHYTRLSFVRPRSHPLPLARSTSSQIIIHNCRSALTREILPDLTIVDKLLDEKFSIEDSAAFDMAMIINSTKTSADVYDNLAHYLFNEMITTQGSKSGFDFFSPWTWLSILGWILGVIAFILVIMLRIKIKPLFVLLMARGSQAASLGITLPKYTLRMPPTTTPSAVLEQWIKHVSHVPSLLPAEILILLCLVFVISLQGHCYAVQGT